VRPEQLRTHHGEVRCGHCRAPFNALDQLLDEPAAAPPSEAGTPPAAPEADVPGAANVGQGDFFVLEEKPSGSTPGAEPRPLPFATAASAASPTATDRPDTPVPDFPSDSPGAQLDFEIPDTLVRSRRPPETGPPSPPVTVSLPPAADTASSESIAAADRIPDVESVDAQSGAAESAAAVKGADTHDHPLPLPPLSPRAPREARVDAKDASSLRARRWLQGLGIGVLLGALAVQAAYLFREDITRNWPQLRPAYLAACEYFKCTVPLPRVAGAIGIETSDLQSGAGGAARFILNATIRNRAPYPQAYPHLELTLTDAQDRPVVRRVLDPHEWVPAGELERGGPGEGFRAQHELVVILPFEAADVAAVGYRLYLFYP
jgi:hypothetical protein